MFVLGLCGDQHWFGRGMCEDNSLEQGRIKLFGAPRQ